MYSLTNLGPFHIFCLISLAGLLSAHTFSDNGAKMTVLAESGLSLRADSDPSSKRLLVIPYRAEVRLLSEQVYGEETFVEELPGYELKGRWKFVEYQGNQGFVFEKYLSHFPPEKQKDDGWVDDEKYLEEQIGGGSGKYNLKKSQVDCGSWDCTCGYEREFNQGIRYISLNCEEGKAGYTELILSNTSLDETYLLAKMLYYQQERDTIIYNKSLDEFRMDMKIGEAGCWDYQISKFDRGGSRITYYCGC